MEWENPKDDFWIVQSWMKSETISGIGLTNHIQDISNRFFSVSSLGICVTIWKNLFFGNAQSLADRITQPWFNQIKSIYNPKKDEWNWTTVPIIISNLGIVRVGGYGIEHIFFDGKYAICSLIIHLEHKRYLGWLIGDKLYLMTYERAGIFNSNQYQTFIDTNFWSMHWTLDIYVLYSLELDSRELIEMENIWNSCGQ